MNSTLLDTNVLLRYLLDDIEEQGLIAEHLIDGGAWTTPEVLAEVTYVLDSVYNVPRASIAASLNIILNNVKVSPPDIIKAAVDEYQNSKLDFVDCIIVAYGKSRITPVFSFDKAINKALTNKSNA